MNEVKIGFTGDVAFSRHYKDKFEKEDLLDEKIVRFLHENDYNVFNIEGAMCRPTHAGTFVHNNPPECVPLLSRWKPSIWNLANNHMMDAGPEGCMETIQHATEAGFKTIGAGKDEEAAVAPVIIPEGGGVGIFSLGYQPGCVAADDKTPGCSSWNKLTLVRKTIKAIKEKCRWCVAVIHGGREFCDIPMQNMRERYAWYLRMGVDVVVAHHPHVPQNWEKVGDKYVFYSLGNFIFDTDYQRAQLHTDTGVLLRLKFTPDKMDFEAIGTHIDRETGVVSRGDLPAVFRGLTQKDYDALYPLAARKFIRHIAWRVSFLHPDQFTRDCTGEMLDEIMDLDIERYDSLWCALNQAARTDDAPVGDEYADLKEYLK